MSWEAWFTLVVVIITIAVLIRDLLAPAVAMFGAMVALLVVGVVSPPEAFSGFSNPAPITVAALYVLARAVESTGALAPIVNATLGSGDGERRSLIRLLAPTTAVSALVNNTPIVAMLVPSVANWADGRRRSASRYLMPLSFAAILGGVLTVIGTSTNIVIAGQLVDAGYDAIGFFEIAKVGLPVAALGLAVIVVLAPLVIPDRRSMRREAEEEYRQFVVDMDVEADGAVVGKTVTEAGLRHLQGGFLSQIERIDEVISPVGPNTVLHSADRLRFVGRADQIVDLQNIRGLVSPHHEHVVSLDTGRVSYFEAVVGAESPLVGESLRDIGFRARYQAVVVAIHRAGQRVDAKLGQVPLRVGDTLLMVSDPGFKSRWRDRHDFLLIAQLGASQPAASPKAIVVGLVTVGIVVLSGTGLMSILEASLLGVVALLGLRVLTPGEARGAVDLDVIVMIASAFGVAAAMEKSGLADEIASLLVDGLGGLGSTGVLAGAVIATVVLTELITNNAAALLMFPIALGVADQAGIDPRGAAIAVAVAASASFLTPIGYQTNTMVYGPGGYRYGDYSRLGAPLTMLTVITIVLAVPVMWPA